MLNVGELSRITKELILGLDPTNPSQEAMDARREIAGDLEKMRADGIMPDLPSDFDFDIPNLPPPPPSPTDAELVESQLRIIRNNLGSGWGFALALEAEEKLEQEICGELGARIRGGPPILSAAERDAFLVEIADLERTNALPLWQAESLCKLARWRATPPTKKKRKKKKRTRGHSPDGGAGAGGDDDLEGGAGREYVSTPHVPISAANVTKSGTSNGAPHASG